MEFPTGSDKPSGTFPDTANGVTYGRRVGPITIAVAVGLGLLMLIIIICVLKHCCKCSCCRRPKPPLKQRVLNKMNIQKKSSLPFSVSGMLDKK